MYPKTTPALWASLLACFVSGLLVNSASAQGFPFWFGDSAILEVEDIYAENAATHTLKVRYEGNVDQESLDGEDIWVVSRNGYNELAKLEKVEVIDHGIDFDIEDGVLRDLLPEDEWIFGQTICATYSLPAPSGDVWRPEDNGSYTVLLQPEQVALTSGGHLGAQLMGMFSAAVGQPRPVVPNDWSLSIVSSEEGRAARVKLDFGDQNFDVQWGEVMRDGNRLFVKANASFGNDGPSENPYFHNYALNDLEPGSYRFEFHFGDELLAAQGFSVRDPNQPVEADVEVDVYTADDGTSRARVLVHFHDPEWRMTEPGDPVQEGNRILIDAKAERVVPGDDEDLPEPVYEGEYDLGILDPGAYTLSFCINGQVCPVHEFRVAARPAIQAVLRSGSVPVGATSHQFHVHYNAKSAIDLETLGADDIKVLDPIIFVIDFDGPVPPHMQQNAKLVSFEADPDTPNVATALYEIVGPADGWQQGQSPYFVYLNEGSVGLADGTVAAGEKLGQLYFAHGEVEGEAHIDINLVGEGAIADVHGSFFSSKIVDPGAVTRDGNVFYIDAKAEPNIDGEVSEFHHEYRLDLSDGGGDPTEIPFRAADVRLAAVPEEGLNIVMRSDDEWLAFIEETYGPIRVAWPNAPLSFEREMLIGVFLGKQPVGTSVDVSAVNQIDGTVVVDYQVGVGGVEPPEGEYTYPWKLIAVPQNDLPVRFNREEIFFPSPPPGEGPEGEDDERVARDNDEGAEEHREYIVVFRVNGVPLARAAFDLDGEPPVDDIPADATIDLVENDDGTPGADVYVEFPGPRYYIIDDWGTPRLEGRQIILPSQANEVAFVREPDEPLQQRHRYQLPALQLVVGERDEVVVQGEPIDFERLDFDFGSTVKEARKVVIQNAQDWVNMWPEEIHPVFLPPAPPVDLEEFTIIGVFRGEVPGCHGVGITDVTMDADGAVTVYYGLSYPQPNMDCAAGPFYPGSLVAIPKVDQPVEFVLKSNNNPFPLPPIEPLDYEIVFTINGQPFAHAPYIVGKIDPPHPWELFPDATIESEVAEDSAKLHTTLAFSNFGFSITNWGEIEADGHHLSAHVSYDQVAIDIIDGELPENDVFEHTYEVSDLEPGFYSFEITANGHPVGHSVFLVGKDDPDLNPFEHWLDGIIRALPPSVAGELERIGDLDGDGVDDFAEYALGLDPTKSDAAAAIRPEWVIDENGHGHLAICYNRRKALHESEATKWIVEASGDMHAWNDSPELFEALSVTDLENGFEEVTVCLRATAGEAEHMYMRLRVE